MTGACHARQPSLLLHHPVTVSRNRGFTLLEMLVALVVIAIGLSVATIALKPDPRRPLAQEAERLALLFEQAREESRLSGTPLAWQWRDDGYVFLRRELTDRGAEWRAVVADELFRERRLSHAARILAVRADGRTVSPGERVALYDEGAQTIAVDLALEGTRAHIESARDGRGYEVRLEAEG